MSETCVIPITTPLSGREQTKVAGVYSVDDIVAEPFAFRDGCLIVSAAPGLVIQLDQAKVEKYRVA